MIGSDDHAHRDHAGGHRAGDRPQHRAHHDHRIGEAAGHLAEQLPGAFQQVLGQAAAFQDGTHHCSGADDGIIEITATGGTVPLKYTLNPGSVTSATGIFNGLIPGTYIVSVEDAEGCGPVDSSPFIITEPPPFVIDSLIDENISCNGIDDGTISIYMSGGVPPYDYSVDNQSSWSTDSLFTDLAPDIYEVYIRDANLCLVYGGSFALVDPPLLSVTFTTTDITTCADDTTGAIEAIASGGTGVLEYSLGGLVYQTFRHFQ